MSLGDTLKVLPYTFVGKKAANTITVAKIIIGLIFIILCLCVILMAVKCRSNAGDTCKVTPVYLEAMSQVLRNMDSQGDPCDDFYQYACGGWLQQNRPPAVQGYTSVMSQAVLARETRWRSALEKTTRAMPEGSAESKMKDFFQLCIREYGRMKNGGIPFVKDLLEDMKGWYVTNPDTWQSGWDLTNAITKANIKFNTAILFYPYMNRYQDHNNITYLQVCI